MDDTKREASGGVFGSDEAEPTEAEVNAVTVFHDATCRLDHNEHCGFWWEQWENYPRVGWTKCRLIRELRDGSLAIRAEGQFEKLEATAMAAADVATVVRQATPETSQQ